MLNRDRFASKQRSLPGFQVSSMRCALLLPVSQALGNAPQAASASDFLWSGGYQALASVGSTPAWVWSSGDAFTGG